MQYDKHVRGLVAALAAGVLGAVGGTLTVAAISGALRLRGVAPFAVVVGVGVGAAGFAVVHVLSCVHTRRRVVLAMVGTAMAATTAVDATGVHNLSIMATGMTASCQFGLGRCVTTGVPVMPVMTRVGPVQRHPVVHLLLWGAPSEARQPVEESLQDVGGLGQPLLQTAYGVAPAKDGGRWTIPGGPQAWLVQHKHNALTHSDLAALIRRAQAAKAWPDTPQTQWWLVADLSGHEMGLADTTCADHIHVPGVSGVVVRLPLRSCQTSSPRSRPVAGNPCGPVAAVRPTVTEPASPGASLQIRIGHEFAEAATDPTNGWRILVAPLCQGYIAVEIADVCSPDGSIISAPAYQTKAGWQPSLLRPPEDGHPAQCVDPALATGAPAKGRLDPSDPG